MFLFEKLCAKLEKLIQEIAENRMQQLKVISDKEIANLNKQTHEMIKLKKKRALQSSQDKEEYQRYIKIIKK